MGTSTLARHDWRYPDRAFLLGGEPVRTCERCGSREAAWEDDGGTCALAILTETEHASAVAGYLAAAGWLVSWLDTIDASGEHATDFDYDGDHRDGPFTHEADEHARGAVDDMLGAVDPDYLYDVREYLTLRGAESFGHDLWLTRNGHGAGYWDRGLGALGERLSSAARSLGEVSSYVTDDGQVDIAG